MNTSRKEIRMLIAKTSLDGQWRGVVTVAPAFRDAGMEVVYAGRSTAQQIVQAALQEDGLRKGGSYDYGYAANCDSG